MDALINSLGTQPNQIGQLVVIIVAIILGMFVLRFFIGIAISAVRIGVWVVVATAILYVTYLIMAGRV